MPYFQLVQKIGLEYLIFGFHIVIPATTNTSEANNVGAHYSDNEPATFKYPLGYFP